MPDVCVVGAGYAGLTAALRLSQAGRSVVVLEARNRVGGRVWTSSTAAGVPIDLGGAFVGPHHDRFRALAAEMGVATFPTYVTGDNVLVSGSSVRRYRGDVPRINPLALLSAGQAIYRLDAMARKVPVEAPWEARRASQWDSVSTRAWMSAARVPTRKARALMESFVTALFCCDMSEVSLLDFLFLVRSAGGINSLMSIEGGYQQDQFVGGAGSAASAVHAQLGGAVVLDAPVTSISWNSSSVTLISPAISVTAPHVVITTPPCLTGAIRFDPPLPGDRALLYNQMPAGTEIKILAVYDSPWWRDDGVTGASLDMDADIEITLDSSPPSGGAGVLACFAAGPKARRLASLSAADRRAAVLDMLRLRFGPRAATPVDVVEQNWAEEEWSRGCSMAHFGVGALTQYGRLLRAPLGPIHWAGTETATVSHGAIDGAVRSGERAAAEVLAVMGGA